MQNPDSHLEKLAVEHQTLRALLQCPVCLDIMINPARTKCGHIFCTSCIEDYVSKRGKKGRVACPSCKVMGVTKRSLESDRIMAELVVEVRRLLQAEKEDTNGHINFLEIRVVNDSSRESASATPTRPSVVHSESVNMDNDNNSDDMLDMIDGRDSERKDMKNSAKSNKTSAAVKMGKKTKVASVIVNDSIEVSDECKPSKRRLTRRKRESLAVSTVKQVWNKEKGKQRKTYSKAPSTPSTENISLQASQVLPGEELSGDEEYWEERRKRNLPRVTTESKIEKVGRWLGDSSTGEYVDLASQPNPSQNSVSTPSNRSFLPPRDLPDISPLDRVMSRAGPIPLSPLDTNVIDKTRNKTSGLSNSHSKIKKQNQLWDKMVGKESPSSSPALSDPNSLSATPTMSQVMPNSCQVDVNDTFDKLVLSKKTIPPQPPPQSQAFICSQMSSLDDSIPALLSPGVSLNIIKSLESDSGSGEGEDRDQNESENTEEIKENVSMKDNMKGVGDSDTKKNVILSKTGRGRKGVSLSDLLADEERPEKTDKKKVSFEDSSRITSSNQRRLADEKKSPGWSKIKVVISELESSCAPQSGGKYPALNMSTVPDMKDSEESMDIETVESIELEGSSKGSAEKVTESVHMCMQTGTDSFPSVISASVNSEDEKVKSFKVLSALCLSSPGPHAGWGTQEATESRERCEKVGRLVEIEQESMELHEAEIAKLGSNSSGLRGSFNLDISTCELERMATPQNTEDMVAKMGDVEQIKSTESSFPSNSTVCNVNFDTNTTKFVKPAVKKCITKSGKVSFSLVGRISGSISKPRRERVVSFLQLGRLATPSSTTPAMPSLRDILAKTSSYTSEFGDPTTTPLPRQSVAKWLMNLHTPDSINSGAIPVLAKNGETSMDMGVQTSQSLSSHQGVKTVVNIGTNKEESNEDAENEKSKELRKEGGSLAESQADLLQRENYWSGQGDFNTEKPLGSSKLENKKAENVLNNRPTSPPTPTLSNLLQSHLASISPAASLSSKRNAKLGRKKSKTENQGDPFLNPIPGTSGEQKKNTRAQVRTAKAREDRQKLKTLSTEIIPIINQDDLACKESSLDTDEINKEPSQIASSCPESQIADPWVINTAEESNDLPDIDREEKGEEINREETGESHQPFMAKILGTVSGLYSQDKETREEELERVARLQFEEENQREAPSPVRKRGRLDDTDEDSPAKGPRKKAKKLESDDDSSQDIKTDTPVKKQRSIGSVQKTPKGTTFENTFQEPQIGSSCSQVIEIIDSQDKPRGRDDWTEEDMELPVMFQPTSQGTQSKSLLDSPSISANISRTSSISSSFTSDSEQDQRTTQEIKRDLKLAELRADKLRKDMYLNAEVLGSQAFFNEMTNNRQTVESMAIVEETESIGLNEARRIDDTEAIENQHQHTKIDDETKDLKTTIPETEPILGDDEMSEIEALDRDTKVCETEALTCNTETEKLSETEPISTTIHDNDDVDLFSQTPDETKPNSQMVEFLSPVPENTADETSQVIKPTHKILAVDTAKWKFVTSNLLPTVRKIVPEFIASLECQGLVGKVDDTVTHIIVSTGEELEAQRTLKYLQGVASGVMIVSHLWVEACIADRNNLGMADKWEVTDEELMGANGPWRARKRREEGREPLLSGFQVLIDGDLEGLDKTSVEDLLFRVGARAVPDRNSFSFTSDVIRLVLVDSTANIGAKLVGKLLRTYKLAMVDKDWLLDTIGGHCIKPIMNYTVNTVQKVDLERAGYRGPLIGE